MPRFTRGPFAALALLPDIPDNPGRKGEITRRKALCRAALRADGCIPNGTLKGKVRDPDWDNDLEKIVSRSAKFTRTGSDGNPRTTRILLETLRVEVDDNDEICAWIFNSEEL